MKEMYQNYEKIMERNAMWLNAEQDGCRPITAAAAEPAVWSRLLSKRTLAGGAASKSTWSGRRLCWQTLVLAGMMTAACMLAWSFPARAEGGLELSTDYPGVSVKPGDSLNISLDLENQSGSSTDVSVAIQDMPEGWDGYIQGGSYQVRRVHVKSGEEASVTLHLNVPEEMTEGTYQVSVAGTAKNGGSDILNLEFQVEEENAGRGSFTSEYPQQEGASGTEFSFSTTLINNGLTTQSYSLSSNAPAGWTVAFSPSGESTRVAGIDVDSSSSQGLTVKVTPPDNVEAGDYKISCSAVSAQETLSTELDVTITGTYEIYLSTPDGRLSFDANAGKTSDVTLQVANTGNVDLENISLNSTLPSGWTVTYDLEDNIIESLPAGTTTEVIAHVKPDSDAITGDYVSSFSVSGEQVSSGLDFRVSVKTDTVWGLVAVAIILCTMGGLGYVFRRYGRR